MANTREPILQPIPILSLRPTQMTVGMREVKEKRKRLREYWKEHKSKKKQGEFLGRHMIPVVLGPDKRHYVVDHHHLARALHDEGIEDILVTVIGDLTMVQRDAFWATTSRASAGTSRIFRNRSRSSRTILTAALPANCGGLAVLPKTPPRSANSCGRISCAVRYRALTWMPTSKKPWKKAWRSRKARMRSICRAGADPRRTTNTSLRSDPLISGRAPTDKIRRSGACR